MAFPKRQVIAFCGDGGLSMLMGDLLTIVSDKLPIKIIVFNNSTLGMVRLEMMVGGYPFWGTENHNPDFSAVARAIGFHAERVERKGRRRLRDRAGLRYSRTSAGGYHDRSERHVDAAEGDVRRSERVCIGDASNGHGQSG